MVEAIRSYHARRGRLSPNQRDALLRLGPRLDLAQADDPLDLDLAFARTAQRTLEIGSGLGDTALSLAAANPDRDYIAADVHTKGIARTLLLVEQRGVHNLRVLHGDALAFLEGLAPACLQEVLVFFPDPWPKVRHHKRRLVRPGFVRTVARVVEPGGTLHLATDDVDYANAMRKVIDDDPAFRAIHDGGRVPDRPRTKYEAAGEQAGRYAVDLVYRVEAPSKT